MDMVGYSARHSSEGGEVMFIDHELTITDLMGQITELAA
jgi:hypothetical protein